MTLATLRRPALRAADGGIRRSPPSCSLVLTAVFDNVMIAAGLFTYPAEHLSGLRIGLAPLEDFSYPLCAAFLVPGCLHAARRAHRSGGDGVTDAPALRPGAVVKQLFVASRPVSWINTAYPFAAAYLLTTRQIDLTLVIGTLFFLIPYNLAMYGINDVFDYESDLRNPRKGGAHGAVLDRRMHRITLWAAALSCAPFVRLPRGRRIAAVVARPGGEPLLRRVLQRAAAAAEGGAVRRLGDLQHPLLLARRVRPRAGRCGLDVAAGRRDRSRSRCGASPRTRSARCRMSSPTARPASRRSRRRAAPAGPCGSRSPAMPPRALVMLATPWPGPLAALVALLYLATVWPFRTVTDETAERATAGWRRFLWINQIAGFVVTLLLIWWWILTG